MVKIDLGGLARAAASSGPAPLHPRDIFGALPNRSPEYPYLRGPQDQVLDQWFTRRDASDLVIKMNTGGGKTGVGLLIGKSCLNEQVGPVAYLVPDRYLADQVRREAARLGIDTVDDPRAYAYAYASGQAILVDTFQRLFNGRSVFGVSGSAGRPPAVGLGTVIIDDAHACLTKAEQVFTLSVPAGEEAYQTILDLFADDLEEQSPAGLLDLRSGRGTAIEEIPHWAWYDRRKEVLAALHPLAEREPFFWAWSLLVDVLPISRAVLTADALEITPPCLPADTVTGFRQARRHVYLTATLADDGILVTDLAADPECVAAPIVPANAGDIGDRLILVPEQTHPGASDADIRQLVVDLAADRNVVVIVPSHARADYWRPDAALVLDKDSLAAGVATLREDPAVGLVVLVNRYDGVDLPGDACHVLVLDGLPEALDGLGRLDQAQLAGSATLLTRQVQRLEQGMGRATRSNDDHCVVLLLGARLAQRLHGTGARAAFSPATRAQLDLSAQIAEALVDRPLTDLRAVIDQCLDRDPGWVSASRSVLASLRYGPATVDDAAKAGRAAFDRASVGDYRAAVDTLRPVTNAVTDPVQQGYLQQQVSAYLHPVDPVAAQQVQRSANSVNRSLLRPRAGVTYEKLSAPTREQGLAASAWLQQRYGSDTELLLGMKALLDELNWGPRTTQFESAWASLAWHLGWAGQQPERDTGRGPDDLWALGTGAFYICEAKSGTTADHPVYKRDAGQLSNATDWFRDQYPASPGTPVLIHPRADFEKTAAVPAGCRVVTTAKLAALRASVEAFAVALADTAAFRDPTRVGHLLHAHGFTPETFLERYTAAGYRRG